MAVDAEAELDGRQDETDATVADDGAGGAAAGISHVAEAPPPVGRAGREVSGSTIFITTQKIKPIRVTEMTKKKELAV